MSNIGTVCVYCGSNKGVRSDYETAAVALGETLVERSVRLVYGGASVGLMGVIADTVLEGGGEVIGVMPEALVAKEVAHEGLTRFDVTASMHERKARMAELSDAFIALPGGLGTLEELTEIWTWGMLGFHRKPCGLLNVGGYYDGLIRFFDQLVSEGFLGPAHRSMLRVADDASSLLTEFEGYDAPDTRKWLDSKDL